MKRLLLLLIVFVFLFHQSIKTQLKAIKGSHTTKSFDCMKLTVQKYYHLVLQYKDDQSVVKDYNKAYYYLQQAVEMGDSQIVYSIVYPYFKKLGFIQDYKLAVKLFAGNRSNNIYFYGLCLPNDGAARNKDSMGGQYCSD